MKAPGVGDFIPTLFTGDLYQVRIQLRLTEEATLRVVRRVTRIVNLVGLYYAMVPGISGRQRHRVGQLIFGKAGGVRRDGYGPVSKNFPT